MVAAASGLDVARRTATMRAPLRPQDIPELVDILTHQRPLVMRYDQATGLLRDRMAAVDWAGSSRCR